jgi:hypothetical protein
VIVDQQFHEPFQAVEPRLAGPVAGILRHPYS